MAWKFIDKLKNVELSKAAEVASGVKESLSSVLSKKCSSDSNGVSKDGQLVEQIDESMGNDEQAMVTEKARKLVEKKNELQEKVLLYLADNREKLNQWYSESQINEKISTVAKKAGGIIIYPVLLLFNLLKSPSTLIKDKMFIMAPLAYFILPTDLIPDFMVGLGYADDGLALMKSIETLSSSITPEIQEQTKLQCEDIFGEMDEKVLSKISDAINENQDVIVSSIKDTIQKGKQSKKQT